MKLYWKHILWNHTIRLWYLWKYRNDKWKDAYCVKLVQTGKEMKVCEAKIKKILTELSKEHQVKRADDDYRKAFMKAAGYDERNYKLKTIS